MRVGEPRRCADARYHDREWGVPVHDDRALFEFLVLEGAQAGLSWSTILRKRDGYRHAFADFDPAEGRALRRAKKIAQLLPIAGIVRNRLKVEAAVRNARAFLEVQKEFGSFDALLWRFVGGKPHRESLEARRRRFRRRHRESDAFSKDLKQRGFSFVGSTIIYAHMQAVGMVNDHLVACFRYRAGLARLTSRAAWSSSELIRNVV